MCAHSPETAFGKITPALSPTVYPSTSSAVAPGRKSRGVDFASNRDRRIGYCQQSGRELSRLLAAGLSFPFVINGCVCHLLGQPTERRGEREAEIEGRGTIIRSATIWVAEPNSFERSQFGDESLQAFR